MGVLHHIACGAIAEDSASRNLVTSEIAVVFHSGYGHEAVIAGAVARGVEKVDGASVKLIPVDAIDEHWEYLERDAKAIISGSPTCMGSASAQFEGFMDASSKYWGQVA
nr:hypothetical protein [Burkholderia territorii]